MTVTVHGHDLEEAPAKLAKALFPYPNARIVTMTQKSTWLNPAASYTSLLVVIEYEPPTKDE